ncbi:hypothetical protein BMS3Abin15_00302 [bacterium BMS3Abin15]|nr:hypothetical protein BMS3Abin15_00302 [bacterium BMS3Abin15]
MNLSKEIRDKLRCPVTKARLEQKGDYLESQGDSKIRYPIVDDIPVLINNENSLFSIDDFTKKRNTTFDLHENKIKKQINKMLPKIGANLKSRSNFKHMTSLLPGQAKILVVGGSIEGKAMDTIYSKESFEVVGTDVSFGPYTKVISDGHDIPFDDQTFDCVIVQAVLEHVLDPNRCVHEIHRVLKPSGIVYAETPFMQQVHMKQYDFTRYTHLGLRRLFRQFEEIKSGACGGPGMALAWSYAYFLKSFTTSAIIRRFLNQFAAFTSFFLKYFDYYLIDKPGSYDAAAGFFFMGKKSDDILPDKELIKQFKGVYS